VEGDKRCRDFTVKILCTPRGVNHIVQATNGWHWSTAHKCNRLIDYKNLRQSGQDKRSFWPCYQKVTAR